MYQVKLNGAFLCFFHKTEISCSFYSFPYTPHDNRTRLLYIFMPFQSWQNIKFTYLHQVVCWIHQVACWIHQVACWIHEVACWIHQVACWNIKLLCWIHQVALLNTYAVPNATKYQVYIFTSVANYNFVKLPSKLRKYPEIP
jgi:hypothetical protein